MLCRFEDGDYLGQVRTGRLVDEDRLTSSKDFKGLVKMQATVVGFQQNTVDPCK